MTRRPAALLAVAGTVIASACTKPLPTGTKLDGTLHVIRIAASAPALAISFDSFWAVKGQDARYTAYFHSTVGQADSGWMMTLLIPAQSLLKRADGTAIHTGDSVHIYVEESGGGGYYAISFLPVGTAFSTYAPAQLIFNFGLADPDLNQDGAVNAADDTLRTQLHIWGERGRGLNWTWLASSDDATMSLIEADLSVLQIYAVAY